VSTGKCKKEPPGGGSFFPRAVGKKKETAEAVSFFVNLEAGSN